MPWRKRHELASLYFNLNENNCNDQFTPGDWLRYEKRHINHWSVYIACIMVGVVCRFFRFFSFFFAPPEKVICLSPARPSVIGSKYTIVWHSFRNCNIKMLVKWEKNGERGWKKNTEWKMQRNPPLDLYLLSEILPISFHIISFIPYLLFLSIIFFLYADQKFFRPVE